MGKQFSRLQSPAAIQAALDEFASLGRVAFLARYGFGQSRDYLVRNPRSGELADSKAIAGVAYGLQFPEEGALKPQDFSGGEATVQAKLQSLGFEVVRIGEDWTQAEVDATVASYFQMLELESQQTSYNKTAFNAALRQQLKGRSKASVELKLQNISAVLSNIDLPTIRGYKPRGHSQLLLRKAVQQYVLNQSATVQKIVDALEEVKTPGEQMFTAVVVQPPQIEIVTEIESQPPRVRLPRKIDFAARDESNRSLGRAGEQWVLDFEHKRLVDEGSPELFERVDWISDRLGDGAGYDILSYDAPSQPRYIEVKTTNGSHASSFIISRNELDFSQEVGDSFFIYRLFQFRQSPTLYMLQGDVSRQLHLEPLDYRTSFKRFIE